MSSRTLRAHSPLRVGSKEDAADRDAVADGTDVEESRRPPEQVGSPR